MKARHGLLPRYQERLLLQIGEADFFGGAGGVARWQSHD